MPTFNDADKIRILVATDSHVGYEERDPIRKDDSWRSFDEVMTLAKTQDVDMVLLAGDLFHDNKPSRKAIYQVMRSLRMNCLGEKPCELEMLSDPSEVLDGASVNYEDPDINVAIPVFSIHGNHDDPTGDGHYCSLDLLQVSGLLNYIGRIPESDKLEIKPVLLQKGKTKLALYGMSNVRDERLFRTFRDGNVKFFTPGVQKSDWFNLMAVHQNHTSHTETGYLPEGFLPDFMDLVVWGHEHECLIDPRLNPEMSFHVMQPGSSIATSLIAGEAVAKHVAIVTVCGKEFTTENFRIKSVRPFVTKDIVLADEPVFLRLAKKSDNRTAITLELQKVVEKLIDQAKAEWESVQDEDDREEETPLPLIRLRVEHTAPEGGKFDLENPQRFSNRFIGKVANQNDVVSFHRKKKNGSKKDKVDVDMPNEDALAALGIDTVKVEKLVQEFLNEQKLKILPQIPFGDAVGQFINKDDKHAMDEFVKDSLATQVKELLALDAGDSDDDLATQIDQLRQVQEEKFLKSGSKKTTSRKYTTKPRPADYDTDLEGVAWKDNPESREPVRNYLENESDTAIPARATANVRGRGRAKSASASILASDDDAAAASVAPPRKAPVKKATPKRAPAKKATTAAAAKPRAKPAARGKKAVIELSDDDEEEEDQDVDMIDEQTPVPRSSKPQPKRAAATRATRQTQLTFSQPGKSQAAGRRAQVSDDDDDDEISDDDDFEPMVPSSRRR